MSVERTDTSRAKSAGVKRRIKMPDGKVRIAATDPKEIASELRAKSSLGRREARQDALEAKL
ncbi:hypothetical protein [Mesorhizobium dulcispinae]|uniref:hypothetical protein n=1 Tax=Mesorhizobium dulcispinae TaxID=3072316 RepID=UPI002A2477A8|nr:hypothetical protein [Mesorhizobium sp. VK23D]MDX8521306.1 hypothetical protein [Mesorhizobium sp. VK23D]